MANKITTKLFSFDTAEPHPRLSKGFALTDIALTTYPPKNFNLPPLQISRNAGGEPEIHNLKKKFLLNI